MRGRRLLARFGLLLVLAFAAQASVLAAHGHAPGGDWIAAEGEWLAAPDGAARDSARFDEDCPSCEIARRIHAEPIAPQPIASVPVAPAADEGPAVRAVRAPAAVALSGAPPRGPPASSLLPL